MKRYVMLAAAIFMLTGCLDNKCSVLDCGVTDCGPLDSVCPQKDGKEIPDKGLNAAVDSDKGLVDIEFDQGRLGCEQPLESLGLVAIRTRGSDFVDENGREVIFHGVNISGMEWGQKDVFTRDDLHVIARAGFNAVRFPIGWAGIEPEKGKIDQAYLNGIRQVVDWAEQEGLYVMIDMHQWFWCKVGMPRWTCLKDPKLDADQEMKESRHFFESSELRETLARR